MASKLNVEWTKQSLKNATEIATWILYKFSKKEVHNFRKLLVDFEKIISQFPDMFPESSFKKGVFQAVVHKNLTIYYTHTSNKILVVAMRDNRQKKIE